MQGASTVGEVERRFFVSRAQAERFLADVGPRLRLVVHDLSQPMAFARTTYLDTDDFLYYKSEPVKRRLRVREYAASATAEEEPRLSGVCALELKEVTGSVRAKARLLAPSEVIQHLIETGGVSPPEWRDRLSGIRSYDVIQRSLRFDVPAPRVTTWYRRATLAGESGRVRVTLDEGLRFCRPVWLGRAGEPATPPDPVSEGPKRIVEVKTVGMPPAWLDEATRGLEEAPPTFSKFTAAIESVLGRGPRALTGGTRPIEIPSALRIADE